MNRKLRTSLAVAASFLLGVTLGDLRVQPANALLLMVVGAMALSALLRPWRE